MAWGIGLALLSAICVALMVRTGLMDVPGPRSSHDRPTPKGGGIGIVVAALVGVICHPCAIELRFLVAAGSVLAVFSYADDRWQFRASLKLAMQVLAALVPLTLGMALPLGTGGVAHIPSYTISFAWVMLVTNAVNFIDGLNGLASGAILLTALFAMFAIGTGDPGFLYFGCLLLVAGIAGFLPFNFPRARIFMGDVGSQFIGFMMASLGLRAGHFGSPALWFIPMCLFGILFDVVFTLVRRAINRDRLMMAHRGHLYQLAQRSFLSAPTVAVLHWAMVFWGAWLWEVARLLHFLNQPAALAILLMPQIMWLLRVMVAAQVAKLERW
jgi:UDP-GlcNAc:undecaprenyl-phosphate GlcNAc-1-phosphate transferase